MTTIAYVKEAISALKDRTGSSVIAINKYIEGEKKTTVKKHVMRAALKRAVEDGTLTMVKNSYKLSPEAKKTDAVLKPVNVNKQVKKKVTAPKKAKTTTQKKTTSGKKTSGSTKTKKATTVKKTAVTKKASATVKKATKAKAVVAKQ